MKNPFSTSKKGFTLMELLIAMTITTIIITVLVSVTSMSLDTWNRSRAEIRASRQAKAVIDTITKDFESMVARKTDGEWLLASAQRSSDGPKGLTSPNATELLFFSAVSDRYNGNPSATQFGDVSGIGYRLNYKDPINDSAEDAYRTFIFYRKQVEPEQAFQNLMGSTDLRAAFASFGSGSNAIDARENFICENIYQLTISFHVNVTINGQNRTVIIPVSEGSGSARTFRLNNLGINSTFNPSGVTATQLQAGRVVAAEVSISVLTDFGIQQMKVRNLSGTDLADFVAKHSYMYSKVIQVPTP